MGMGAGGGKGFVLVLAEQREPGEAVWLEIRMVCEELGAGGQALEHGKILQKGQMRCLGCLALCGWF